MSEKKYKWNTIGDYFYNWFTKKEYRRITFFFLIGTVSSFELALRIYTERSGWGNKKRYFTPAKL